MARPFARDDASLFGAEVLPMLIRRAACRPRRRRIDARFAAARDCWPCALLPATRRCATAEACAPGDIADYPGLFKIYFEPSLRAATRARISSPISRRRPAGRGALAARRRHVE